jgi:hypothetical protein
MVLEKAELLFANIGDLEPLGTVAAGQVIVARSVFRDLIELERRELLQGAVPQEEKEELMKRLDRLYKGVYRDYNRFQIELQRSM